MRPVGVTRSRVQDRLRYPRRVGVHSPHEAPMHCSSSSRITCSIRTCTALTARRRKYWRNSSCSGMMFDADSEVEPSGDIVVGLFLETGMTSSFLKNG